MANTATATNNQTTDEIKQNLYLVKDSLDRDRSPLSHEAREEVIEYAKRADAAVDRRHRISVWCTGVNVTVLTIGGAFVSFTFEAYGLWSIALVLPFISVIGLMNSRHAMWEIYIQREYVTAKFYTLREADKFTALRLENRERAIRNRLRAHRSWSNGRSGDGDRSIHSDRYDVQIAHWWRVGWLVMLVAGLGILVFQAVTALTGNTLAIVPI
ncbi:MAG: hypothetical protein HKM24_00180 [Gammaproteobacteria bacterium]|nr:hypothetical protein [Gammaproteobacteria bacterium]